MLRTRGLGLGPSWDPWRDFARMQADAGRLFHEADDAYGFGFPPIDVWASEDEAVVTAELPGVPSDRVEISVLDDTLTLEGSRAAEDLPEGVVAHRRERGSGSFSRSIRLPFRIEASAVDAKFEHGVLEVRLPRAEEDRPRRIPVHHARATAS